MERIPPNERVSNIPDPQKKPTTPKDEGAKKSDAAAPPSPRTDRYEKSARRNAPPQAGCLSLFSFLFFFIAALLLYGIR